jgi:hypothetical protein
MRVTGDSSWPEKKYWKDFSFESFEKKSDCMLRRHCIAHRAACGTLTHYMTYCFYTHGANGERARCPRASSQQK